MLSIRPAASDAARPRNGYPRASATRHRWSVTGAETTRSTTPPTPGRTSVATTSAGRSRSARSAGSADTLLDPDATPDDPDRWVIGLSGGKDSVALTQILDDVFGKDPASRCSR